MALFQNKIFEKYLQTLDSEQIDNAYEQFCLYFHDEERQKNILQSKEEQFQEGFLRELFVKILGYTLNPDPNYNLITEKKDVKDSKKADGAILQNGETIGIVELKDHKTPDLGKVERQAFGYKNQHKRATYVIISNFQKLRFYIDNAVEFIEWDLFRLTREEFSEMWLCLSCDTLLRDLPKKIKSESLSTEEQITNQLYKDYITFKRELFQNILNLNTTAEGEHSTSQWKILLFKKTQKLLDRLLFIFFAEDSGLLPPNSIRSVIDQWRMFIENDEDVRLYSRFKKYFGYMNTGYKGKKYEVFAYNGGLFKPDEVLDNLEIDDEILAKYTQQLSDYDFQSDVDVNILGHIFENSLNEIEEVTAQLEEGQSPTVSKRKKDGVFYTPQYITKYIVENTVGRLCNEKKAELGINEQEYFSDDKRDAKVQKRMVDTLTAYRNWLLQITICDPACGSGAFLNAALRFLMDEHRKLDEMEANVTGYEMVMPGIENSILENNLYGVDINEESVEIARLALWLRTAKPQRKLSSLNNNIKCGNSLISDPAVAGDKAFDWEKEFPQVFAKGGFDVVIGNPPYVRAELLSHEDLCYYQEKFDVYTPDGDLFSYFYNHGMNILNTKGVFGFISNTFDKTSAGEVLRHYITDRTNIDGYIDFTEVQIFEGATTYPIILLLSKTRNDKNTFPYIKIPHSMQDNVDINSAPCIQVEQSSLSPQCWSFQSVEASKILKKLLSLKTIKKVYGKCYYGVKTALNDAFFIDATAKSQLIANDARNKEIIKPVYEGKDLNKWHNPTIDKFLLCTHNGFGETAAVDVNLYPAIKEHLDAFEPKLSARYDKGNTPYNLRNCAYQALFYEPKIIWGNLQNHNKFSYDDSGSIISAPACMLPTENKTLLCILNSKIVWFFLTQICVVRNGGYIEVKPQYFEQIPIPEQLSTEELDSAACKVMELTSSLQSLRSRFHRRMRDNLSIEKITTALETFDDLTFSDFQKELKKQKVKLSLTQQNEWEEFFEGEKQQCLNLRATISKTEKEIDLMVYELYGLSEEEINIVEQS